MNSTKKILSKICLIALATTIVFVAKKTFAHDLPVFYRAPMLQDNISKDIKNWTSTLKVRYANASTYKSHNSHYHTSPLLSIYGDLDLTKMGWWVDNPGTKTNAYWGNNSSAQMPPDSTAANATDGKVAFFGHFKADEVSLHFQQNIASGLFVSIYAPYREVRIEKISYKNLGTNSINVTTKDGSTTKTVDINNLLTNDLNAILTENGYKAKYDATDKKSGIPEVQINLGWQGFNNKSFGIIDSLAGTLQAGIICPCGHEIDQAKPFEVALGSNNFWGFSARGSGEVTIWKYLCIGAVAGANVFLRQNRIIRMKTHENQSGWFRLEQAKANVDPGSMWDIGFYAKIEPLSGVSFLAGYSMNSQEEMTLDVRDGNFLQTRINAGMAETNPVLVSQDYVVNHDDKIQSWHQHTLHAAFRIDGGSFFSRSIAPILELEYDYPFYGKRSFRADAISGTAGVKISLGF